jgi:hypothetical protein
MADLVDEVGERLAVALWDLDDHGVVDQLHMGPGDAAVHVFSDEWINRQDQVTGFIRARAGLFDRRIGARECELREVPRAGAKTFLETFHVQGANRLGVIYFGLYMGSELVGLLSLGRHSRQIAKNRIVFDRLCFRSRVQVVGGAARLLRAAESWAKKQPYDEIITFSDNRLTDGSLYEALGFELDRRLKPDYCYVKDGRRFSKQSQRKESTKCPDGMTEHEWAMARGLKQIYDAGKKRWLLNLWPGLHRTRNELSSERARNRSDHWNIRGYFDSDKNNCSLYYASSYELRCMFLLEQDPAVKRFHRCQAFKGENGWRNPDLWVEFVDDGAEVWEVKPERMLVHDEVQEQIRESRIFAESKGAGFRVWTEEDTGLESEHHIIKWARDYLVGLGNCDYAERRRKGRKRIRERHYAKVSADKIEVWCGFCEKPHTQLRLTYERNIKRNGRYICIRENGHLIGQRPKTHMKKTNLYAAEGKKQCSTCLQVKPVEGFDVRRASWDGRSPRCKDCCKRKKAGRQAGN